MPALSTATSLSVANPDGLGDTVFACAPSDAQFDGSNLRSSAGVQGSSLQPPRSPSAIFCCHRHRHELSGESGPTSIINGQHPPAGTHENKHRTWLGWDGRWIGRLNPVEPGNQVTDFRQLSRDHFPVWGSRLVRPRLETRHGTTACQRAYSVSSCTWSSSRCGVWRAQPPEWFEIVATSTRFTTTVQ